ncbi:hypothetical protein [Cetobacterium somerae]
MLIHQTNNIDKINSHIDKELPVLITFRMNSIEKVIDISNLILSCKFFAFV